MSSLGEFSKDMIARRVIRNTLIAAALVSIAVGPKAFAGYSSFSTGCLVNDTSLRAAEGLSSNDPAAIVTISPARLWPPNHRLRDVAISMSLNTTTTLANPVDVSLTIDDITDDQIGPDDAGGDGCGKPTSRQGLDWSPDLSNYPQGLQQTGSLQTQTDAVSLGGVQLRAERCAALGTRTYTVSFICCDTTDPTNPICDASPESVLVTVPKSRGRGRGPFGAHF